MNIFEKKYPNSECGALLFLAEVSVWNTQEAEAEREDNYSDGVYLVRNLTIDSQPGKKFTARVYLAHYKGINGKPRRLNDWEDDV